MSEETDIDPFVNEDMSNLTKYEKTKILFMSIFVAPIRVIFSTFFLLLLWPTAMFAAGFRSKEDEKKPLDGWRLALKPLNRLFSRAVFFCGGFYWVKVVGEEDKDVKILAMAPHCSYFDALGIVYLNFPSVIGRAGSDNVPLFGYLTRLTQPLIVDRDDPSSRSNVVKTIIDRLNSPLKWPKLAIYAEGTCTNRKALLSFKPGAFLAGLPVQPVCFIYKTSRTLDSISWSWKSPPWYKLYWYTICQFHNTFELHYLPVYTPNEEEKKNAHLYANNVRNVMAEYLKLPLSDFSFEDVRLMTKMEKYNLPGKIGRIKVVKIMRKFGINMDTLFDVIPLYAKLTDLKTGLTNMQAFSRYMQIKPNESLNDIFYLFDQSKKGYFSFAEFVDTYFGVISAKLNLKSDESSIELEKIYEALELEDDTRKQSYDNFNKILLSKIGIEFEDFNSIDKSKSSFITKNDLDLFLKSSPIHLFLLLNLFKNNSK